MKLTTNAMAILALSALAVSTVQADEVVLKSGERREGRVETIVGEPGRLAFISSSGRLMLPKEMIVEIVETDDATDYTILGNQFLKAQSHETAVQMFQKALEADPSHPGAKEGLEQAQTMIRQRQAEAERTAQSENSDLLQNARDLIVEEKFAEAERALDSIAERNPTEEQRAAVQLVRRDLYLGWGKAREDRLDPVGAEAYFNKVVEIDPGNAEAKVELLKIWEGDSSKREVVLAAYQEQLAAAPDDLTLNRKVADLLLQLNRSEEAIAPLTVLFESGRFKGLGYDDRLASAMESTAVAKAGTGDLDGAIATYEKLLTMFPTKDPSPLAYLAYEKRLRALAPDDWTGRAGLLPDLKRQGLNDLAVQEANTILQNDPENQAAIAFLREDAIAQLQEAQFHFDNGEFTVSRDMARQFAQTNIRFPDLIKQAEDLYTKSNIEAQRQARAAREQAREIASRGDEYLSEAKRYAELMKNRDTSDRTTVLSYKQEAIKFAKRAIDTYNVALQVDPSVGPVTGADVNTKLSDAKVLYASLTAAPLRTRTGGSQRPRV